MPAAGCPAQGGEGGLVAEPVRVGAGGNQQLGGGVCADTMSGTQRRIDLSDKGIQLGSQVLLLLLEEDCALRQCLGGGQHRDRGWVVMGGGSASGQRSDQGGGVRAAVAFAQLDRPSHQQGVDLVGLGGVRLDRAAPRAQQRPHRTGAGVFGHRGAVAGQRGARSSVGVQRVGLALAAALRRDPGG